ncbi:protein kinase [Salmonella enterica]|uniref:Protein kinase n=1 Tax=Salmonella enterica TaxID=28901 RepID=A0A3F3JEG2_SALER|nr:protein kinase [Salmonella enterica]EBP3673373.1 protein kinase [Salmonella enterica subsp. enterica]EDW0433040.1 protein kinase [Salmonella enterica subsp. enterica serovar Lexington]EAA7899907.1 protein kinase [Salmonella enterica]EAA9127921.1 protein kinase [Salmonella enterica]EAM8330628.1 protein kinase [Salmonella enterica]
MKIPPSNIQTPFLYKNHNSHTGIVTEPALGKLIGEGSTAEVFEDGNDSSALYKKYDLVGNQYNETLEMARQESDLFNAFYGDEASIVIGHGGDVYLRMLRVPGIPLSEIDTADIPDNLESLYLQLICKLNELGVIHYDLNTGNMLYDKESESLFPIDFRNIYTEYYSATKNDKEIIDRRLQMRTNDFYSSLNRKYL